MDIRGFLTIGIGDDLVDHAHQGAVSFGHHIGRLGLGKLRAGGIAVAQFSLQRIYRGVNVAVVDFQAFGDFFSAGQHRVDLALADHAQLLKRAVVKRILHRHGQCSGVET